SAGKARKWSVGPGPVAGAVRLHDDRRSEWGALGFTSGPQMMALARRALPRDLDDSRALREAEHGQKLRLAGLVAAAEGSSLVLLDEHGLFDVEATPGVTQPAGAELVTVEGAAHVRHQTAVLKVIKAEPLHPGIIPPP